MSYSTPDELIIYFGRFFFFCETISIMVFFFCLENIKHHLAKYIHRTFRPEVVKLVRLNERQGLIRARLTGAKLATGDVLIFLDSHCEANQLW